MKLEPYREFWRRHHRVLGLYLTIEAWKRGLDCIVLERGDIEAYLQLKRIDRVHVRWLKDDLTPWFKHQVVHYRKGAPTSFHSLFLSRDSLRDDLFKGSMTVSARVNKLKEHGVRVGTLFNVYETVRITEEEILPHMAALAVGLKDP